jgi:hypothetical protein
VYVTWEINRKERGRVCGEGQQALSAGMFVSGSVSVRGGLSLQPPVDAGSPLAEFCTLKMEAICSSETSVNPGATQPHIPEYDILHSHRCENLKSYEVFLVH